MISSMTGFGRGQAATARFAIRVEIRSVNNRNLRVTTRMPDRLQGLEIEIEKIIREAVVRGALSVAVELDDLAGDPGYVVDPVAARFYRDSLRVLSQDLGLAGDIPLHVLVTLPGVVARTKDLQEVPEDLWNAVRAALNAALADLVSSRRREGVAIRDDMLARARAMTRLVDNVARRAPAIVEEYRRRLADRLARLLEGIGSQVREEEVHREIAFFADRCDISEEITRLRSHLTLIEQAASAEEPSGRRLEFVTQEMFREANTMGSKSGDADTIQQMLDIKAEIEKLREQALNVE